jgi:hypothetical protein
MWESDRGGVTLTAISETSNDARNSVLGWCAVGWLEAEVQQCLQRRIEASRSEGAAWGQLWGQHAIFELEMYRVINNFER